VIRGLLVVLAALAVSPALAKDKPDARAAAAIQDCVKSKSATGMGETCIGIVSGPCLDKAADPSTAGMVACVARERAVWDDILNETYNRLRAKLDDKQQQKLRDERRLRQQGNRRARVVPFGFSQRSRRQVSWSCTPSRPRASRFR
jgi:uncharacterized protein YecT (DUF1311 family)